MEEKRVVIVNKNVTSYINQSNSCVFFTTGSAEAASHLLSVNPDIMEFVGGDGTFSASLNDALLQNPEFLNGKLVKIMPKGSGNDRYKSLTEIIERKNIGSGKKNKTNHTDRKIVSDDFLLATINGNIKRYVFNIGGIGLDSQTLLEYETMRGKKILPSLKYFGAATTAINKLNGYKGLVNYSSGKYVNEKAEPIMFLFMLGKYFGGGMPINNRLVNNDGLFESVILSRGTNLKLYRSLVGISLLKQSQYNNPIVKYLEPSSSAELNVLNADKFYFESDGEVLADNKQPVEVKHIRIEVAGKINYLLE
jgi:diacylglycerol kinase family enzyme